MKRTTEPKIANVNDNSTLNRCLLEGDFAAESSHQRSRRKALGLSLAIEAVMLGLLIISPLLTGAQPQLRYLSSPVAIALGAWHSHSDRTASPVDARRVSSAPAISMPSLSMRPAVHAPGPSEAEQMGGAIEDPPAGFILDPQEVAVAGFSPPKLESPKVTQPAIEEKKPLKVSEGVVEAQLISRIEPRYSPLALQTRSEGEVRLHAIISRDGRIESLDVVSGPPLLVQAALTAVKQWRYRPTYLNGEPVEVETSITVIFRLQR